MNNLVTELSSGLSIFKSLHDIGRIGWTKVKNRVSTPYRVEKLADDVFSSILDYGSVVTVEGKLTRYSTTYRPFTYAPQLCIGSSDTEINNWTVDPRTGARQRKVNLKTRITLFQFPVQVLPAFEDEKGKFCIAFLYPSDFKGFILAGDTNSENITREDGLLIDSNHRPIPILLPDTTLENLSESDVVLTGVVTILPQSVVNSISTNLCSTREAFYYHFLRPYSARMGFCIDCRDKVNSDFKENGKLEAMPAALYVEGHFEGITEDKYRSEFQNSVPKGLDCIFSIPNCPRKDYYLTGHENVSLIGATNNMFGFYTEADLVDSHDFERKAKSLQNFYTSFRKTAANTIRKNYSIEARFKPDFMFDYRRQKYFHPHGVLSSNEANEAVNNHPDLKETVDWLKNM